MAKFHQYLKLPLVQGRLIFKEHQKIVPAGDLVGMRDPDATFMRMKEDAMRNGQLKPAYNIQHAESGLCPEGKNRQSPANGKYPDLYPGSWL